MVYSKRKEFCSSWQNDFDKVATLTNISIPLTVITLNIGTARHLQTLYTQIGCPGMRHLVRVYTVCHTHCSILGTSRGSRMDFLAHLSKKCSWWAIVIGQCPSSVVHRSSAIALKAYTSYILGPMDSKLVGSIGVTFRSKIAKIVPIGNPRWPPWPPSWKSIFRFFAWTQNPIDLKLGRKHPGDL